MVVENQKIEVKWCSPTKEWYINKGYKYTKYGDSFIVDLEDLQPTSTYKIQAKCDYCNEIISIGYGNYLKSTKHHTEKYACSKCASKKHVELYNKREYYYNLFCKKCNEMGYIPISKLEDYKNAYSKMYYKCPKHGIQKINYHDLSNNYHCQKCRNINIGLKNRLSKSKLIQSVECKNNNKLINPDEYIHAKVNNLQIQCGSCEKIYITNKNNYDRWIDGKCPVCRGSSGEYEISKCLEKYNIKYIRQKKFIDCKDITYLYFDFYLPDYNMCIEFDGQQHFTPIFSEKNFYKTVLHDGMKNNYCKWNNIIMLRIAYLQGHNIEKILIKELNLKPQYAKIKYIHDTNLTHLNKQKI